MIRDVMKAALFGRMLSALVMATAWGLGPTRAIGQSPARNVDSAVYRGFTDLAALVASLPRIDAPRLTQDDAFWLGSLSLGCIDRLQPRPAGRSGPQQRPTTPIVGQIRIASDTSTDPTVRQSGQEDETVPYFWLMNYEILPNFKSTRAFWGCTDWHSAVSSTWVVSHVLSRFPQPPAMADLMRDALVTHLAPTNVHGELTFFRSVAAAVPPPSPSAIVPAPAPSNLFERPYGFAWLLKLQASMRTSTDSVTRRLATNLEPLAAWMAGSLMDYLTALAQPVRTGTQANTALVLSLALDYAEGRRDSTMQRRIAAHVRRFYANDSTCQTQNEVLQSGGRGGGAGGRGARGGGGGNPSAADPSASDTGYNDLSALAAAAAARSGGRDNADAEGGAAAGGQGRGGGVRGGQVVLSPCLSEAAVMARTMRRAAFARWINTFLPPLESAAFAPLTVSEIGEPSAADRARFAAVSLQRAAAMKTIADGLPPTDRRVDVFRRLAAMHGNRGLRLMRGDVQGGHWLPAYALLYLED